MSPRGLLPGAHSAAKGGQELVGLGSVGRLAPSGSLAILLLCPSHLLSKGPETWLCLEPHDSFET